MPPSPLQSPQVRRRIIAQMPNLISEDYQPPSRNLNAVLQRLSDVVVDLQRRSG